MEYETQKFLFRQSKVGVAKTKLDEAVNASERAKSLAEGSVSFSICVQKSHPESKILDNCEKVTANHKIGQHTEIATASPKF